MTDAQATQELIDLLKTHLAAREIMDIPQACAYMGVGETFLRELIALYKIPFAPLKGKKSRGRIRLRKQDIDAYIASQLVHTPQDARRLQDGRRGQLNVVH